MTKSFLKAVENAKNQINSIYFMLNARVKPTYFNRSTGKISFTDAIYFMLRHIKKTMQIELDDFFVQYKESGMAMTKQGFSQLREKINPNAFIDLNDNFISYFYSDSNYKKYRGFRLLSIDGSITEVPNTK